MQVGLLKHLGDVPTVPLVLVSVCSVSSCHSRQTGWWSDQISVWSTGCCQTPCANKNLTGLLQLMAKLMFGHLTPFHYWLYPVWLCMWQIIKNLEPWTLKLKFPTDTTAKKEIIIIIYRFLFLHVFIYLIFAFNHTHCWLYTHWMWSARLFIVVGLCLSALMSTNSVVNEQNGVVLMTCNRCDTAVCAPLHVHKQVTETHGGLLKQYLLWHHRRELDWCFSISEWSPALTEARGRGCHWWHWGD